MTKTKTTPHGSSSSDRPRGMATVRFATAEAEEQQFADAGGESRDSEHWPDPFKKAAKEGEGETSKSGKQVSLKVRQVTNPSRLRTEQRHLPKKTPQHLILQTHSQVLARTPLRPQQRSPPRTPPRIPTRTPRKKPLPILPSMSKITSRQEKFG